MTAIERTAYPRFTRAPSAKELRELYTPTPDDEALVARKARGPAQKLALLTLLKVYQRLDYFPDPQTIPGVVISHLRLCMGLPAEVVPDISPATLYRYYAAIREHLGVHAEGKQVRHVAAGAMYTAAQTMDHLADLINAAIELLLKEHCELPAFSTLEKLARRIRSLVNSGMHQTILSRLSETDQQTLAHLLEQDDASPWTPLNRIKEAPASATLTHLEEWVNRLTWLESLLDTERVVAGLRATKLAHLAEEARSLYPSDLLDCTVAKRTALLICLLHQATISTRDEIAQMFLKRMSKLTERAKQELERVQAEERATTEHLIEVLADVLQASTEGQDPTATSQQIRDVLAREGGAARLLEQCEQASAHHGDRYQPFLKRFYGSHRKALFQVLNTLELRSTTSETALVEAMHFILAHEHTSKSILEATLDLSFASQKWLRTVQVRQGGKSWVRRQHLETCVFSSIADELRSGDLCVRGSEQFADYRDYLLTWEECAPKVAGYCQQLNLPRTPEDLVDHLRTSLAEMATLVDRTQPANQALVITDSGEPVLKKTPAKVPPPGLAALEEALHARIPERHLLDILARIDHVTQFTRHFGPLSGNEPRTADARARQLLTLFAFGTNLGPHQLVRHLRVQLSGDQLAHINRRQITADKLDAALHDVIDRFNRFTLPRFWGEEQRAAADGTQYELAEDNLLAEKHIRYGGYGGIAYHHVSDLYILLFSHFIACGVFEAIYILDGLIRNRSAIHPTTIHADTQGQNLPVFGLSFLLGIQLMPRIRNWKDLKFYRPSRDAVYEHIDTLFGDNVVDWELIKTHWQDLLQVVISIQEGKILPSLVLRKLSNYSRKNRLYQAFHALGCVVRTIFLLRLISDARLREVIHRTTNKVEQYNALEDWVRFARGGTMYEQVYTEQEKQLKYTSLLTNCVILDNTIELSATLNALVQEGWHLTREDLAALSPYQTRQIKRFGNYELDLSAIPKLIADDLILALEAPQPPEGSPAGHEE